MTTKKLQVELPAEDVEFMEAYAKEHGKSVADVLAQYIQRLKSRQSQDLHPEVKKITGVLPPDLDVKSEYHQHIVDKHQ